MLNEHRKDSMDENIKPTTRLRRTTALLMLGFAATQILLLICLRSMGFTDVTFHLVLFSVVPAILAFPVYKAYQWATGLAFVIFAWLAYLASNVIFVYFTSPGEGNWLVWGLLTITFLKLALLVAIQICLFKIRFKRVVYDPDTGKIN
jgi:hypothetical protein